MSRNNVNASFATEETLCRWRWAGLVTTIRGKGEGTGLSNRTVDEWNRLNNNNNDNNTVSAQTLGSFKRRLDKFMEEDDRWK